MRYKDLPSNLSFNDFKDYDVIVAHWEAIHSSMMDGVPDVTNVCSINFIEEVENNRQAMWDIAPTETGKRSGRIAIRANKAWVLYDYLADYDNNTFSCFVFGANGSAIVYNHYDANKEVHHGAVSGYLKRKFTTKERQDGFRHDAVVLCVAVDVFMRHAKVRTIELGPREKQKVRGQKMYNETPGNIRVYDTRFFTDTVGVPFGVTGHTRMQKYGPGRSLVKPVWINPYTKGGVHRKAKK